MVLVIPIQCVTTEVINNQLPSLHRVLDYVGIAVPLCRNRSYTM